MAALSILFPTLDDAGAAAANVTRIQALLDDGGVCRLSGDGIVYIDDTLEIGSNTHLELDERMTLRLASGTNAPLLRNRNWDSTANSVSGITVATESAPAHTYLATVACTAHPFAVGDYALLKGDTTGVFVGVFEVITVPDANSFTVRVTGASAPASAAGTLTAALADYNVGLSGGTIDYNGANNGGTGLSRMATIFNKVGRLTIKGQRALDAAKYAYYIGSAYGFDVGHLDLRTSSDGVHLMGPVRDGFVHDVRGTTGDDFVAYTATNGGGYTDYDLPDCNGEAIRLEIARIDAKAALSVVAIYPGAGYRCDGIRIRDVTGTLKCSHLVNIATVASTTAELVGDIEIDGLYGACGNNFVKVGKGTDAGTIQSLIVRNSKPSSYQGYSTISGSASWTVKTLIAEACRFLFDLATNASRAIDAGSMAVNLAVVRDSFFDTINYSSVSARLFFGHVIQSAVAIGCDLRGSGFLGLWDASSTDVTPTIRASDLRLDGIGRLLQTARPCRLRGERLSTHGSFGLVHAYQSGIAYDVRLKDCDIGANSVFSSTAGTISFSGDATVPVDVTTVSRVNGAQLFNNNAAAGTLGAAGMVDCLGTSSGSWKLRGDDALNY